MTCQNGSPPLGLAMTNLTLEGGVKRLGLGLNVGTPQQLLALWPSTGDDATWVANAGYCSTVGTTDKCVGEFYGVYNSSTSSTYVQSTIANWNGSDSASSSSFGTFTQQELANLIVFNDKISFGTNGTSYGFPMVTENPTRDQSSGLGIGYNSTFLQQAVKSGSAPSTNWGLWTGSRSAEYPTSGALYLGGYDTNRVDGTFTTFTSPNYPDCITCATVTDITYEYSGGSQSLMSNSSERLNVAFQPYEAVLEITDDIFQNFLALTQTQGSYIGYDGTFANFKASAVMGNFSVTISNPTSGNYKTVIPAYEMFAFPRATDNNGNLIYSNTSYKLAYFNNVTATTSTTLNWGWPFLAMNYLVMDFDNKQFRLAPAVQGSGGSSSGALVAPLCSGIATQTVNPVSTPGTSASGSSSPMPSGKSKTNVGAIAGGVVGGVAGLLLLLGLVWFVLRSKKREKALRDERDAAVAGGSEAAGPHHERMSQYTATTPTVVSEYANGKSNQEYNSVNQWLHTQKHDPSELQSHSELEENNATSPSMPPSSPKPYASHGASANMNEPFEMPAYQYR